MDRTGLGAAARNWTGKISKAEARAEVKTSEPLVEETVAVRMETMMTPKRTLEDSGDPI